MRSNVPGLKQLSGKGKRLNLGSRYYVRAAMAIGTSIALFIAISARLIPEKVTLEAGDTAARTIIASRSATNTDRDPTDDKRQRARESVADVYKVIPEADALVRQAIEDIFNAAMAVRGEYALAEPVEETEAGGQREPVVEAMVTQLRSRIEIALNNDTLELLVTARTGVLERIRTAALTLAEQQMQQKIRDNTDDLQNRRAAVQEAAAGLELTPRYQQLVADVVARSLRPNHRYNQEETTALRDAAAAAVDQEKRQIQPGDVVVIEGQTVTQTHIEIAKQLGLMAPTVDYSQALSLLLLLTMMVLSLGAYVRRFAPEVYADNRQMLFIAACLVLGAVGLRFALQWSVCGAISLGVATTLAMMVAMLLGSRIAVVFSFGLALIAGLVATGSDVRLVIATALASGFASWAVSSQGGRNIAIARAAGRVGLANGVIFVLTSEIFALQLSFNQILGTVVGGIISASLAVVAVVALERTVGVVTELSLLELANTNEPVLHRLLVEAPGSYQSAVMVANLAEPAAEEIGANALLVRVAALYHDIGKLKRPYFFVENQFGQDNPHSKLKPHLSALTLIAHARDGYELAKEIRLPRQIADIVRQHHGTSAARYPYVLAVQQEGAANVNEADFRYPGPKPQTREAALVMLADSVEAAGRTLANPTHDQIEELVDDIIRRKMEDGQLDECPLTFGDLNKVRDSFVATLHGMFHQRVKYPGQDEAEEESGRRAPSVREIERAAVSH